MEGSRTQRAFCLAGFLVERYHMYWRETLGRQTFLFDCGACVFLFLYVISVQLFLTKRALFLRI